MNLKPSTALRNDYQQISTLAKASGEPIIITNKGEADLVIQALRHTKSVQNCWSTVPASWKRNSHGWPEPKLLL